MLRTFHAALFAVALTAAAVAGIATREAAAQAPAGSYTVDEIVSAGSDFFGAVSGGLAQLVERAASQYGLPNGYILGTTAGGAFIGGVRYGEGTLYTKNAGQFPVYWQGPSIGLDVGAEGSRTMMLVYNLPSVGALYQRYPGVSGQAYLVGGLGMTVMTRDGIVVVPIISGIGARFGVNVGYLKFTDRPTINPF